MTRMDNIFLALRSYRNNNLNEVENQEIIPKCLEFKENLK
jgi:hypothetical protein